MAVVRLDQTVGKPQQRGLARARAADDREEFAALDMKRDVIDGLDAAAIETLADMVEDDQGGNLRLYVGPVRVSPSITTSRPCVELVVRRR